MADSYQSPDRVLGHLVQSHLRIATWNIWWRFGPWREREAGLISALKDAAPDIVCLQEVWRDGDRTQADLLAEALGMHAAYGEAEVKADGIGFGNAVLSRWPIAETAIQKLSPAPSDGQGGRIALFAKVDGPRGPLGIFSTHLSWKQEESGYRQVQVRELSDFVKAHSIEGFPPVVCGDFNAESSSREIQMLTGADAPPVEGLVFHDVWSFVRPTDRGITWDNRNPFVQHTLEPDRRLDFILVGPLLRETGRGHPLDAQLIGDAPRDGLFPSDHFGVTARLRY